VKVPLDIVGYGAPLPSYRDVTFEEVLHLRVLSVPLVSENRQVGVIQVAANLDLVDSARSNLLSVLVFSTVLGVAVSALASQASVRQFLSPLENITSAADQLNRADDLSRRVPYDGAPRMRSDNWWAPSTRRLNAWKYFSHHSSVSSRM